MVQSLHGFSYKLCCILLPKFETLHAQQLVAMPWQHLRLVHGRKPVIKKLATTINLLLKSDSLGIELKLKCTINLSHLSSLMTLRQLVDYC